MNEHEYLHAPQIDKIVTKKSDFYELACLVI